MMTKLTQPPNKKQRLDDEEQTTRKTLIHLSGDELSSILSFMNSACDKIMMTCTCRSLYLCISQMVKEQSPIKGSLVTIWKRMDEWTIIADSDQEEYDELKTMLKEGGSFSHFTNYLTFAIQYLDADEGREKMFELFCIENGKGNREIQAMNTLENGNVLTKMVPDVIGYSLKHLYIEMQTILHLDDLAKCCCQLSSLSIYADEVAFDSSDEESKKKEEVPLFSNLRSLKLDCEIEEAVANQFAPLLPNLEKLIVVQDSCEAVMKFVDHCSKLTTFEMVVEESGCSLNDREVLEIVQKLPLLKLLCINSPNITGEVLAEIGEYAKNLEYLCLDRSNISGCDEPVFSGAKLGGGQLGSLKEFNFVGEFSTEGEEEEGDEDNEDHFNPETLFDSVIELCPNIQFVNIMDYDRKGKLSYPRNLYGLIAANQMKELILYPYKQEVKRGQNATDVLIEMRASWEQIAQNERVEALVLHQALPTSVLERCSWINVQILVLENNNKEWYELIEHQGEANLEEWLLCLMKACPNVKYLTRKNDAQLKPLLDKILSDNENIWREMQYRPQTKKKDVDSWSEKWLQARHRSFDWVLSYDEVMESFLRGR